ncbi:MAG: Uridylate kinase [Chlamydiia bacterium]|nr:Uridylate kinase [Chlamydiia bacterium]
MKDLPYKRIIVKLSGESLSPQCQGDQPCPVDAEACLAIGKVIGSIRDLGVEVGLVIGGGNIFRGAAFTDSFNLPRTTADYVGMSATVINGVVLAQVMASIGVKTRVMSALASDRVAEPFHWGAAMDALAGGEVVVFAGGTGNPYFTTDTAAALRASEMGADALLKLTKVDGIYTSDPMKDEGAELIREIGYLEALKMGIEVMDQTAITLCAENKIPIMVCSMSNPEGVIEAVLGRPRSIVKE